MICATCGTSGTKWQMAISQQEMVEMLRKLKPKVFNTYKFQLVNQYLYILCKFEVVRCQIYNYIINAMTDELARALYYRLVDN